MKKWQQEWMNELMTNAGGSDGENRDIALWEVA